MRPSDLGLPPKFQDFRRYPGFDQFETALDLATANDQRFQIYNGPTGSGKSLTCATVAALRQARFLVLTGNKGLQSQLLSDGLVQWLIYGHRNYSCFTRSGFPLDDADVDDLDFRCSVPRDRCLYLGDVAAAAHAQSVVTNYAYWMSIAKYSDPNLLGDFDFVVLDEAHTAADWLTRAVAVTFGCYRLRKALDLGQAPTIPKWSELWQWQDWIGEWLELVRQAARRIGKEDRTARRRIDRLIADLQTALTACDPDEYAESGWKEPWTVIPDDGSVTFSPRWGADFAERYLFRGIKRVLLVSATVTEKHATYLGIQKSDYRFIETPSPFDPRRRPLIWVPTVRVDYRMSPGGKWKLQQRTDDLIGMAIDQRAGNMVIHTGSYERTRELCAGSKFAPAIITHRQNSADFAAALERFKAAGSAGQFAIIASPRMQEGIDLPGDLCRAQIFLKVPFPNSTDPLTRLRLEDEEYRHVVISETLQQMCGRPMRSDDDFATNVILDDHWGHVSWQCTWPQSFSSTFRTQKFESGFAFLTREAIDRMPAPRNPVQMLGR